MVKEAGGDALQEGIFDTNRPESSGESQGKNLFLGGDFANHYIWSVAHPDWEVRFDRDRPMAAQTRRRIFDMLATEKMPFIGYHMPWPGLGYIERNGDTFRYAPASYQHML